MIEKRPAFQVYAAEFYIDTSHLDQAELGALVRLMCHQWRNGSLDADQASLEAIARGPISQRVRGLLKEKDGRLVWPQMEELRSEYEALSRKRRKAGKMGGQQTASKYEANGKQNTSKGSIETRVEVGGGDEVEDEGFAGAWNAYGKVGNRLPSLKSWGKLSDADRAACLAAIPAYVETTPDPKFRKHFSTFLNQRAWEDVSTTPTPAWNPR